MPEIPIIGQPKIKGYSLTVVLECTCGQLHLITGMPGRTPPAICKCGNAFAIPVWPAGLPNGEINVSLAMGRARPVEEPGK